MSVINANTRPAIGGGGVTVMKWDGQIVGFCNGVVVTYPTAVSPEVTVQPLDAVRPVEIITSVAIGGGTIAFTLTSLYNQQIWDRLVNIAGTNDLADIFQIVREVYQTGKGNGFTVQRIIYPPVGNSAPAYSEEFLGCVVTQVADGLTINTQTMLMDKQMTVAFAKMTRGSGWQSTSSKQISSLTPGS